MTKELAVHSSPIPGLYVIDLPLHGDNRGWFKENYQKEKMEALGLPAFEVVQNNFSYNEETGATRGLHAEPWEKFISVANGKVFGAWVDLRQGDSFGTVFTTEITPDKAIFVPRGVANGYQVHVRKPLRPSARYRMADQPRSGDHFRERCSTSTARRCNSDGGIIMDQTSILIIGAKGQLGTALQGRYPQARAVDSDLLDITDQDAIAAYDWSGIKVIINAAAYTNVDGAESPEGRKIAWAVNADAVANLVAAAAQHDATLVHISSDYVFDGTAEVHSEDEAFAPLSVYGASKAAGDLAVSLAPKFYILRTSWVIGEGKNFVRTMLGLAEKGISPTVVDDQIGRLTFTSTLVDAIDHLLTTSAQYGTYNVTGSGESVSWADITREIFKLSGHDDLTVTGTTTEEYFAGKEGIAPRPLQSTLDLSKLEATNFTPNDWRIDLQAYIARETS